MLKKELYISEMLSLVEEAVKKILTEYGNIEIYTVSIWTDPDAKVSSISIDDIYHSTKERERFASELQSRGLPMIFDLSRRETSAPDFLLPNFILIEHESFLNNWEDDSEGKCWEELEPCLKEIGEYAFTEIQKLNVHKDFELGVNGRNDWYEFNWKLSPCCA